MSNAEPSPQGSRSQALSSRKASGKSASETLPLPRQAPVRPKRTLFSVSCGLSYLTPPPGFERPHRGGEAQPTKIHTPYSNVSFTSSREATGESFYFFFASDLSRLVPWAKRRTLPESAIDATSGLG